jgi:replicative DNA helicase
VTCKDYTKASDAEAGLVTCLLIHPGCFADIADIVRTEDFGDARYRIVFGIIARFPGSCDVIRLKTALQQNGEFEGVGGDAFLAAIGIHAYSWAK